MIQDHFSICITTPIVRVFVRTNQFFPIGLRTPFFDRTELNTRRIGSKYISMNLCQFTIIVTDIVTFSCPHMENNSRTVILISDQIFGIGIIFKIKIKDIRSLIFQFQISIRVNASQGAAKIAFFLCHFQILRNSPFHNECSSTTRFLINCNFILYSARSPYPIAPFVER